MVWAVLFPTVIALRQFWAAEPFVVLTACVTYQILLITPVLNVVATAYAALVFAVILMVISVACGTCISELLLPTILLVSQEPEMQGVYCDIFWAIPVWSMCGVTLQTPPSSAVSSMMSLSVASSAYV